LGHNGEASPLAAARELPEALLTAGYSKIALTIMAANANPATAPAAMAADNSNMNSPIVIYPTACKRQDRACLCCSARFTRKSPAEAGLSHCGPARRGRSPEEMHREDASHAQPYRGSSLAAISILR
jgi:hypothetical protein